MAELLTSAQMRAVEAAAIAGGEVTGLELMERAGRGVVEAVFAEWPELAAAPHRAVVLCGPGNNGGDGFVVARLLKDWGWEVEVCLYGDADRLPPDAKVNFRRWSAGGETRAVKALGGHRDAFIAEADPDLWIDAFFGTGLTRGLPEAVTEVFEAICCERNRTGNRLVAVDILSGLCSDSGRMLTRLPLRADLTVSFHAAKLGHYLDEGPDWSGRTVVTDIGLGDDTGDWRDGVDMRVRSADGGGLRDLLGKTDSGHKYAYGHALILAGGPGRGGAARLAARGALRIGAGLVTVGCPPEALAENAARLDAIMLRPIHDADALGRVLEDRRINALCLGPGLGVGEDCRSLVATAVASGRALVLDADALTSFAEAPEALFEPLGSHRAAVLTPHGGEFARLFPDIAERLKAPATRGPAYSKVDATRAAAARAGCVVLFKGPDTVIAAPDGRCRVNAAVCDRAAPWLATAGAGDVLAGFIAGLMARGFDPLVAAETAAWLHVACARSFGPGLIAEDLPEELPNLFRSLGL